MHKYYELLEKKQGQILSIGFYKVIRLQIKTKENSIKSVHSQY